MVKKKTSKAAQVKVKEKKKATDLENVPITNLPIVLPSTGGGGDCCEVMWESPKCLSKNQPIKDQKVTAPSSLFKTEDDEISHPSVINSPSVLMSPIHRHGNNSSPAMKFRYASPSQMSTLKHSTPIRQVTNLPTSKLSDKQPIIFKKVKSFLGFDRPAVGSDESKKDVTIDNETESILPTIGFELDQSEGNDDYNSSNKRMKISTHSTSPEDAGEDRDNNWGEDSFFDESVLESTQKMADDFIVTGQTECKQPPNTPLGSLKFVNKKKPHVQLNPFSEALKNTTTSSHNKVQPVIKVVAKTFNKFRHIPEAIESNLCKNEHSHKEMIATHDHSISVAQTKSLPVCSQTGSFHNRNIQISTTATMGNTVPARSAELNEECVDLFNNTFEEGDMVALLDSIESQNGFEKNKSDSIQRLESVFDTVADFIKSSEHKTNTSPNLQSSHRSTSTILCKTVSSITNVSSNDGSASHSNFSVLVKQNLAISTKTTTSRNTNRHTPSMDVTARQTHFDTSASTQSLSSLHNSFNLTAITNVGSSSTTTVTFVPGKVSSSLTAPLPLMTKSSSINGVKLMPAAPSTIKLEPAPSMIKLIPATGKFSRTSTNSDDIKQHLQGPATGHISHTNSKPVYRVDRDSSNLQNSQSRVKYTSEEIERKKKEALLKRANRFQGQSQHK